MIALARLLKSADRYVRRNERALFLKVREGSFLTIADQVIACGGNTERQCTVYADEVRIEDKRSFTPPRRQALILHFPH